MSGVKAMRQQIESITNARARQLYPDPYQLENYLFRMLAPAVYSTAFRTITDCRRQGIRRICFLARDGIGLRLAFEQLLDNHQDFCREQFELVDLDCSRASTMCARFKGLDRLDIVIQNTLDYRGAISYGNLLSAWNLSEAGLGIDEAEAPCLRSASDVRALFTEKKSFASAFEASLESDKELLKGYLAQHSFLDSPSAIVDVGWHGTIQRNLSELHPAARIFGFYIGTLEKYGLHDFTGCVFTSSDLRTKSIVKAAPLLETLLTPADSLSTSSYQEVKGKIEPLLTPGPEGNITVNEARQNVLIEYLKVFLVLENEFTDQEEAVTADSANRLFRLLCFPDKPFIKCTLSLKFDFGWGGEKAHAMVSPISFSDLRSPIKTLKKLRHAPWLFGTLKASRLGAINGLIVLVLGMNQKLLQRLVASIDRVISKT